MSLIIKFLSVFITTYSFAKCQDPQVYVHELSAGVYELEINGGRYPVTPKCAEEDIYKEYQCHIHCALMGSQYGQCQKGKTPLCQCGGGAGAFGNAAYQKKNNERNKSQSTSTSPKKPTPASTQFKPPSSSKPASKPVSTKTKTTDKKESTDSKTQFVDKKETPSSKPQHVDKNEKTGTKTQSTTKTKPKRKPSLPKTNAPKAGKQIAGTHIIEVIDSNEQRMPDPKYDSAESTEK